MFTFLGHGLKRETSELLNIPASEFNYSQLLGWIASGLVLATFCMRRIVALRALALCSNLAFIAYGLLLGLVPVTALHLTLLPLNAWRLSQELRDARRRKAVAVHHDASVSPPRGAIATAGIFWKRETSSVSRDINGTEVVGAVLLDRHDPLRNNAGSVG